MVSQLLSVFCRFWNLLDFPVTLSLQTSSSSASSVNLSFFMSFHSCLINLFTFAVLAFFRQRKVNFHFSSDCVCVTPSNMRSITIIGFLRSQSKGKKPVLFQKCCIRSDFIVRNFVDFIQINIFIFVICSLCKMLQVQCKY